MKKGTRKGRKMWLKERFILNSLEKYSRKNPPKNDNKSNFFYLPLLKISTLFTFHSFTYRNETGVTHIRVEYILQPTYTRVTIQPNKQTQKREKKRECKRKNNREKEGERSCVNFIHPRIMHFFSLLFFLIFPFF